jgi:hypothetical protein
MSPLSVHPYRKFVSRFGGKALVKQKLIEKENQQMMKNLFNQMNLDRYPGSHEYQPGMRISKGGKPILDCYPPEIGTNFHEMHSGKITREREAKMQAKHIEQMYDHIAKVKSPYAAKELEKKWQENRRLHNVMHGHKLPPYAMHLLLDTRPPGSPKHKPRPKSAGHELLGTGRQTRFEQPTWDSCPVAQPPANTPAVLKHSALWEAELKEGLKKKRRPKSAKPSLGSRDEKLEKLAPFRTNLTPVNPFQAPINHPDRQHPERLSGLPISPYGHISSSKDKQVLETYNRMKRQQAFTEAMGWDKATFVPTSLKRLRPKSASAATGRDKSSTGRAIDSSTGSSSGKSKRGHQRPGSARQIYSMPAAEDYEESPKQLHPDPPLSHLRVGISGDESAALSPGKDHDMHVPDFTALCAERSEPSPSRGQDSGISSRSVSLLECTVMATVVRANPPDESAAAAPSPSPSQRVPRGSRGGQGKYGLTLVISDVGVVCPAGSLPAAPTPSADSAGQVVALSAGLLLQVQFLLYRTALSPLNPFRETETETEIETRLNV